MLRRASHEIGLPDLPAILPGGAAGKQDAEAVVGDGRIRRCEEGCGQVAASFPGYQNQVRAVREALPAAVPGCRLVAGSCGVEKRRQIAPHGLSREE